jgi:hypothetical protein
MVAKMEPRNSPPEIPATSSKNSAANAEDDGSYEDKSAGSNSGRFSLLGLVENFIELF